MYMNAKPALDEGIDGGKQLEADSHTGSRRIIGKPAEIILM